MIREAQRRDVDAILRLCLELFELESRTDTTLDSSWALDGRGEKYFIDRIENDVIFVATKEGKVIGYVAGGMVKAESWRTVDRMAEVGDIVVDELHRGEGVGSELLDAFFSWCKEHDVQRVRLEASPPNEDAIRLYERLGFKHYLRVMEKEL